MSATAAKHVRTARRVVQRHPYPFVIASYAALVFGLCAPLLVNESWPRNHDHTAAFERVEAFRRAFSTGDFSPTWSPFPFKGYGSPFPLVYHRLFNTVAGLLALPFGAMLGVKLAIGALLVVGALGMRTAAAECGVRPLVSWFAGTLLLLAPYTITDWLVRGAVAEFAAGMILPWAFAMLLAFLEGDRRPIALALVLVALFHAHSLIAYFFCLLLVVFVGFAAATGALRPRMVLEDWRRYAIAALVVLFGMGVTGLAVARVTPSLTPSVWTEFARPEERFVPWEQYVLDASFRWGERWRGFSVELGRYILLATAMLTLGAKLLGARVPRKSAGFLVVCLLAFGYLQTPLSSAVYVHVPGAAYLQFPWRLNLFLTPILILLLVVAAERCLSAPAARRAWVYATLVGCTLLSTILPVRALKLDYEWIDAAELASRLEALDSDAIGTEYLPDGIKMKRLAALPLAGASNCDIEAPEAYDGGRLVIAASPTQDCELWVRQFSLPALDISLENATLLPPGKHHEIRVMLHPGAARVVVEPKSVWRLAAEFIFGHSAPPS